MTIRLFGFIITIMKMQKPAGLTIDQAQRQADVKALTSTEAFQNLKAKAAAARAARK